jgi:hypothetical protein
MGERKTYKMSLNSLVEESTADSSSQQKEADNK